LEIYREKLYGKRIEMGEVLKTHFLSRLKSFKEALKILESLKNLDREEFLIDVMKIYAAERAIQVIAEFCIDLSNYILLKTGRDIPKTYRDSIKSIGELNLCRSDVIKFMENLIGLRNIIVHMYADVKTEVIYNNLNEIVRYSKQYIDSLFEYMLEKKIDP